MYFPEFNTRRTAASISVASARFAAPGSTCGMQISTSAEMSMCIRHLWQIGAQAGTVPAEGSLESLDDAYRRRPAGRRSKCSVIGVVAADIYACPGCRDGLQYIP